MTLTEREIDALRKAEFPAVEKAVHLKASGGSPMCRSAYDAGIRYLEEMCFEGDLYYDAYLDALAAGRGRIAAMIGATPSEIGFTVNSSSAAAIMAELFVRSGVTQVYYPVGEFPTSVHAIVNQGLSVVPVGDPAYRDGPAEWLKAVDDRLAAAPLAGRGALVISHVSFISGETIDIDEVTTFARDRGLILAINATQSFGALSMDVRGGVPLLFATGLKWACAGYGAGFVYIHQDWVDTVGLPNRAGWLSVDDPYRMDHGNTHPIQNAASLDAGGGMPQFSPLMSLNGALSVYERLGDGDIRKGIKRVEERVRMLAGYLKEALLQMGFSLLGSGGTAKSGIVSVQTPDAPAVFDKLKSAGVLTSLRRHPQTGAAEIVRFGVHYFNTKKELDKALSVIR